MTLKVPTALRFFLIICTVRYRKNRHSWIWKRLLQQRLLVCKYPEDKNKVSFIFICPTASAIAPNTVLNKWGKLKRSSTDHHQWSSSMTIISSLRNSSVHNNKNKHPQLDGQEFEQAPGVGNRQGSLVCCSPWGHKESDTTKRLKWTEFQFSMTISKGCWEWITWFFLNLNLFILIGG